MIESLDHLARLLGRLPGVGRRSAERMAQALVRDQGGLLPDLIAALQAVQSQVSLCSLCGNLTTRPQELCAICRDPRRDGHTLCVVEEPSDILLVERAGAFHGRYHALLGKLSPMQGEGLPDRRIAALLKRVESDAVREVILALNSDVESDATASYLARLLAARPVKVTRLAFGLPAGSALAYSDPVTLSRALQGRSLLTP